MGLILLALVCKKIARRKYLKDLNEAVSKYVSEYSRIEESKLNTSADRQNWLFNFINYAQLIFYSILIHLSNFGLLFLLYFV